MIFTFYSYKGGVGRSMALANVAESLYLQGARILMIDWDLEAPGLESFFYQSETDLNALRAKPGLIDLLLDYCQEYANAARRAESRDPDSIRNAALKAMKPLETWIHEIHPPQTDRLPPPGLWLMPAGRRHDRFPEYAESVHDFDWAAFYSDFEGEAFFEWLRQQLVPQTGGLVDAVLIDSRTGITEMGGVCTQQLADVVVAFTASNLQNLLGVETMATSFRRPEILQSRNGKPEVIIVPSRVDASELESRNRFEKRLRAVESKFIPPVLQSLKRSFWDLKIPYIPKFTYEEALTIRNEAGKARYIEAREMADAYRQLAATMVMLTPSAHPLRSYAVQDTATLFQKKRVYLTWAGVSGVSLANSLRLLFESDAPDLDVWLQQREVAVPVSEAEVNQAQVSPAQVNHDIAFSSSLLLAITSDVATSVWVREEWLAARRNGVCVYGVYSGAAPPALPRWMGNARVFDSSRHWKDLLQALRSPCFALRAPFMAPDLPAPYVAQPALIDRVRGSLTPGGRCLIRGPGGIGKSAIAAAVCHHTETIDTFADGILWVTLGPGTGITSSLTQLYAALTGERPTFSSEQDASYRLGTRLIGLNCLIVLDEVTEPEDVTPFYRVAKNSAFLLISRNTAVAPDAVAIDLEGMTADESIRFLNQGFAAGDSQILRKVAEPLGGLPLALKLARDVIAGRVQDGAPLERAVEYVDRLLTRKGPADFPSVRSSIEEGLGALSDYARDRFYQLVVFPEGEPVRLSAVATMWGVEEFDAEELIQQFTRLSLLKFDPSSKALSIHPVTQSYLQTVAWPTIFRVALERLEIEPSQATLLSITRRRDHFRMILSLDNTRYDYRTATIDFDSYEEDRNARFRQIVPSDLAAQVPPDRPLILLAEGSAAQVCWEAVGSPRTGQPWETEPGIARLFPTLLGAISAPAVKRGPLSIRLVGYSSWDSNLLEFLQSTEWEVKAVAGGPSEVIGHLLEPALDIVHFCDYPDKNAIDAFRTMRDLPALLVFNRPPTAPSTTPLLAEVLQGAGAQNIIVPSADFDGRDVAEFLLILYRELRSGRILNEALRKARKHFDPSLGPNFQHYGNPFFRLPTPPPA